MKGREWKSRTKRELMIEVWEHLDCESVGAKELEAVIGAVRERFGEGAELRHAEVLEMDVRWRSSDPYEAMFRNVLKFSTFDEAAGSIRRLDNLRRQFERRKDREGLRRVQETVLKGKRRAQMIARNPSVNERKRAEKAEIAEWFTVWLNQPDIFDDWLALRQSSKDFRSRFGGDEAAA